MSQPRTDLAKLALCLVLLIFGSLAAAFAEGLPEDAIFRLEHFGEDGEGVPEHVRGFLPADFFTGSMTEVLASRLNYTAFLQLPKTLPVMPDGTADVTAVEIPVRQVSLELHLTNQAEQRNDIVVSAQARNGQIVRNFLVPLASLESVRLNADALTKLDSIYFISLSPFGVEIDGAADDLTLKAELEVMPPRREPASDVIELKTNYCVDKQRPIEICVTGTNDCVGAWAKRYDTHWTWPNGWPLYYLNVDYPLAGNSFHRGTGGGLADWNTICLTQDMWTYRPGTTKRHVWDDIDQTIFHCQSSTAECYQGCGVGEPKDFTVGCSSTCTNNNDCSFGFCDSNNLCVPCNDDSDCGPYPYECHSNGSCELGS